MKPAVQLFQIAYSAETSTPSESEYKILDNTDNLRPDWYELWPIRRFLKAANLDESTYYGFFSPRFQQKTGVTHWQIVNAIAKNQDPDNVFLFTSGADASIFFWNVFAQWEYYDPGFTSLAQTFCGRIGLDIDLTTVPMDSRHVVFSQYLVAKPDFWRKWLAMAEQLFAICEDPSDELGVALNAGAQFAYRGGATARKVFMAERLASLLLASDDQFKGIAPGHLDRAFMPYFENLRDEAVHLNALKMAYVETGDETYRRAYHRFNLERVNVEGGRDGMFFKPKSAQPRMVGPDTLVVPLANAFVPPPLSAQELADLPERVRRYPHVPNRHIVGQIQEAPGWVLDVGCNTGATGAAIKEKFPQTRVVGIEPDVKAAQIANDYLDYVFAQTFEEVDWQAQPEIAPLFDLIVLPDVLEHMYLPWQAISQLASKLRPGGHMIASIPNVRNMVLIDQLAKGHWPYADLGLHDATHIRFFTPEAMRDMMSLNGLKVTGLVYVQDARCSAVWDRRTEVLNLQTEAITLHATSAQDRQELGSLQLLVVAQKTS
jgi:2-polyprenyl-3-methyl-5-hydroxy-6-metoxy-1,4-benzoquinol methylase